MLAHSPPLPIVIDYHDKGHDFTAKDEEGIVLALQCRYRVRRVRLCMSVPNLRKFTTAMDEEYPILEHLIIEPTTGSTGPNTTASMLESLQAPNLRHLILADFSLSMQSRFLTSAVGLVTLCLFLDPSFQPNTLLQSVSFMPQLETLVIVFPSSVSHIVEIGLSESHTPITTHTVLPSLRLFSYEGGSAYLEALAGRIITPSLQQLRVYFFNQDTFPIPHLLQFVNTTENLRFGIARLKFSDKGVDVVFYPCGAMTYSFGINVQCLCLNQQVSSTAQIFSALSQVISPVEHLILECEMHSLPHKGYSVVDRTEWRQLLRTFSNAKTLYVGNGIAEELSCFLPLAPDDGEHPLELLPELQELEYSGSGDLGDTLTSFIDARRIIARPVILIDSRSMPLNPSMPFTGKQLSKPGVLDPWVQTPHCIR